MTPPLPPLTTPLIVVDLQNAMIDGLIEPPLDQSAELLERVGRVLTRARASVRPVAFIRHEGPQGDAFEPGSPGWPIIAELGQTADEPTFSKSIGDAFSNPALPAWLDSIGATGIILLGAQTDFCIAATVNGALNLDLDVAVVADAHGTVDSPDASAGEIIRRYNAQFAEAGVHLLTSQDWA